MKLFKKLALLTTALTLALSFGAFAACVDDKESSSSEPTSSSSTTDSSSTEETPTDAYVFIVQNADGSAAKNVSVQLCTYKAGTTELDACYAPVPVDAQGKCVYDPIGGYPGAGVYEIHLLDDMSEAVEFEGPAQTTAEFGTFTLILK